MMHTYSTTVQGIPLMIEWDIDVDTPDISSIWIEDSAGDDISGILDRAVIKLIEKELNKEMQRMEHAANADRAYATYHGRGE